MRYLLLLLLLIFPTSVSAATLTLTPASGSFNKGCTFTLSIDVDTQGKDTDGTDAILIFDSSKFITSTSSIQNGKIYSDYPGNSVDPSGKISISGLSSVSSPFNGKGSLATITFTVNSNAQPGATSIRFDFDPNDKAKTTDSNVVERGTVVDLLNQVFDGNYTVGTGSCNQQTVTPSPSPASSSGITVVRQGGPSTPSATQAPLKSLPPAGITGPTAFLAITGAVLTVLGIVGLALL